jgi:bifunctional DNA-binding transcriptional regulator/antitoxin component of YhaV-PrlF toxin-antitoxin module
LPKEIREYLHAETGTQIHFLILENGNVVLKAINRSARDLEGILKPFVKRPVTLEEMNEAIRKRGAGLPYP